MESYDTTIPHLYDRILDAISCGDCSCDKACTLLEKLVNELNLDTTDANCQVARVCGCR